MKSLIPSKILKAYDLGKVRRITVVSSGLIHQTYKISAEKGMFILQRLHPVLASKKIADDFLAVTSYLHVRDFPAPQCVLTKTGRVLARDEKHAWRMQTFIAGATHDRLGSLAQAREAGAMYARLHATLNGMRYTFTSPVKLHRTRAVYRTLMQTVRACKDQLLVRAAQPEIDFLRHELPSYFLPADLPKRVIHGDPKTSNILFDARGRAKAVVDLDTCNRHTILVDLGDAFRSWCAKKEDDANVEFRLDLFRAGWSGYAREATFLTARERRLVPQAIQCITLELAARFLTDYFTDSYFGWDPKRYPTRRAHNLARARGQIALFKDIKTKRSNLTKILQ